MTAGGAARRNAAPRDEEEGNQPTQVYGPEKKSSSENEPPAEKTKIADSIFTWKNLNYTVCQAASRSYKVTLTSDFRNQVRSGGEDLKLLDNVQGWCAPGQLTA